MDVRVLDLVNKLQHELPEVFQLLFIYND